MIMRKYCKLLVGLIVFLNISSCKDIYNICNTNTIVTEKSGFYRITNGVEGAAYAPLFTLISINATSAIYHDIVNISRFTLTLNPLLDSAKFAIYINLNSSPDTITFFYTSLPFAVSPDCGSVYVNNLSKVLVTKHHLDSARVINNIINTQSTENVKIYF